MIAVGCRRAGRDWLPARRRVLLASRWRGGALPALAVTAALSAVRRARGTAHGAHDGSDRGVSATLRGYLASAGAHAPLDVERTILQGSRRQFLSRHRRASGSQASRSARRFAAAEENQGCRDARRDARRDRRDWRRPVARRRARRSTDGCSLSFRRCRACVPLRASATCSCSRSPCSAGSRAWTGLTRSAAIAVALIALVNIEAMRAPFHIPTFHGIPGVYRLLAEEPGPVIVVEAAVLSPRGIFQNAA